MQARPRPYYAEKFSKRSFISTVRPTAYINPSRKQGFSKTAAFKKLNMPDKNYFQNRASRKRWGHESRVLPIQDSFKNKFKMTNDCCGLNFSSVVWTRNISCVFRKELRFQISSALCGRYLKSCILQIYHVTVICSVSWPLNGSEAGEDLVLIKTSAVVA